MTRSLQFLSTKKPPITQDELDQTESESNDLDESELSINSFFLVLPSSLHAIHPPLPPRKPKPSSASLYLKHLNDRIKETETKLNQFYCPRRKISELKTQLMIEESKNQLLRDEIECSRSMVTKILELEEKFRGLNDDLLKKADAKLVEDIIDLGISRKRAMVAALYVAHLEEHQRMRAAIELLISQDDGDTEVLDLEMLASKLNINQHPSV